MPYVLTTRDLSDFDGYNLSDPADRAIIERDAPVTRRAVATLEEARWACAESIAAVNVRLEGMGNPKAFTPDERAQADEAISENGGTLGPLPSGAIIEVERVLIENLIFRAGIKTQYVTAARYADTAMADADVIDAFNAAQES